MVRADSAPEDQSQNPDNEMEAPKVTKRARLKSLDCFRGYIAITTEIGGSILNLFLNFQTRNCFDDFLQ